jgi:hypothetical protein
MTGKDNLIYGGIAVGSMVFLWWIIPAYTPPHPGYGVAASLLPNVTVGIILAISVLALAHNLFSSVLAKSKRSEEIPPGGNRSIDGVNLWHLFRFMIPCVLLMPAMMWIGFVPAGLVFMLLIQYLCGQRKAVPAVIVALGTVFFVYGVMRYGLGAPMP